MAAYLLKRLLLIIPTLFGIMLISFAIIQFAPGGPVERIIAQLTGHDFSIVSRIGGGGTTRCRHNSQAQLGQGAADAVTSKYRGAQGLDPEFIKSLEKQFGFDKPALRALLHHDEELPHVRLRQELLPRRLGAPADQGEDAGLDLARAVDDADLPI